MTLAVTLLTTRGFALRASLYAVQAPCSASGAAIFRADGDFVVVVCVLVALEGGAKACDSGKRRAKDRSETLMVAACAGVLSDWRFCLWCSVVFVVNL